MGPDDKARKGSLFSAELHVFSMRSLTLSPVEVSRYWDMGMGTRAIPVGQILVGKDEKKPRS